MAAKLFETGAGDVLYLVDLSGYVFRAYHALPPLTSPTGEPTHAVLGTVTMLERLVRQCRPQLLAVAMDSPVRTFRKELYSEYKAHRPLPPEDLASQVARVVELVEAFAIPILREDGLEADDVIATAVAMARQQKLRVVIVSADKDLMQLVGDDVVLWDTMRDRVIGPEEVMERFGVAVSQVRDLLALMGDSSDNVPGVPSIGPKTARDLLVEHATLAGVFAHLDSIPKRAVREALRQHQSQAELSQELVTLRTDARVVLDLGQLKYGGRDVTRLRQLYAELGFQRLAAALDKEPELAPLPGVEPAPAAPVTPVPSSEFRGPEPSLLLTADELREFCRLAHAARQVALEPRACGRGPQGARLAGIGLSIGTGQAYYLPLAHRAMGSPRQLGAAEAREGLGPLLADPEIRKVGHDLKGARVLLFRAGLELAGFGFDTLLASYLLDPEAMHGLEAIARRELGVLLPGDDDLLGRGRSRTTEFDEVGVAESARHVGLRVEHLWRMRDRMEPRLVEAGLGELLVGLELPLATVLADLEIAGVGIDTRHLGEIGRAIDRDLDRLQAEAHRIAGRAFNVNAPRQLEVLLFDQFGLKPVKRTKTARSTDAETLAALAEQHELPRVILEIRQLQKLKGTYVDTLPGLVDPETGRIHTSWEQAVAATGRLSSTEPNLQNIPIRTELGRSIREAFVAPPGCRLVSADYSQIELRILAHLSQDPVLMESFRTGEDIHTRTAMAIFDLDSSQVTAEHRRRAKAVNFGIIYGQGDSGLARSLGISRAEASNFIAAYYRRHQGVRAYMEATLEAARASESVRSLLGHRRMVPDIRSANRAKRLAAERIAMNMPIQGTAAELLKLAMLNLARPTHPGVRMILTVHDELVFEVPEAHVEEAMVAIRDHMEKVHPLSVPLLVDVGQGRTWSEAH